MMGGVVDGWVDGCIGGWWLSVQVYGWVDRWVCGGWMAG